MTSDRLYDRTVEPGELLSSPLLLSVIIVVVFLFFQVSFIWVAVAESPHDAMHAFWQPEADRFMTPYFAVISALGFLFALYVVFMFVSWQQSKFSVARGFYSLVVLIVLGGWSMGMWHFWQAMAFERGEISAEQWFDEGDLKLYRSRHLYFRSDAQYLVLEGTTVVARVPDGWQTVDWRAWHGPPAVYFLQPKGPHGGTAAYPELSVHLRHGSQAPGTGTEYVEQILSKNAQLVQLPVSLRIEGLSALKFAYAFGDADVPDNSRLMRIETFISDEDRAYICRTELALSQLAEWRWAHDQFCNALLINSDYPRPL